MIVDDKRQVINALKLTINQFPGGKGKRNCELLPRAACLAVKAGWDVETFADAIKMVAPDMASADIRKAYITANRVVDKSAQPFGGSFYRSKPIVKPKPKFPNRVRSLINAGRDVRTLDDLVNLSPLPLGETTHWGEIITQMRWLFPDGNDSAYIFRIVKDPTTGQEWATPGVIGKSIMRVDEWLHGACETPPDAVGEQIVPNPLTGRIGETADGRQSFIAQSCIASFRHLILEFDEMPLDDQCSFWAGFIRAKTLPLVCLVYSGGKSIHGCIRVNAANAATWNAIRDRMIELYATDEDPRFCADRNAMKPRQGMRLAGIKRQSTGNWQRLVWACSYDDAGQGSKNQDSGSQDRGSADRDDQDPGRDLTNGGAE